MSTATRSNGKQNFDDLYVQPDPRAYFRGLGALDYEVPQHGERVFSAVLDALDADQPTVVDLCSSYGVNAALLKHDINLDDLYRRYREPECARLTSDALADADQEFFASCRYDQSPRVVGIDAAAPAVEYAVRAGVLDAGYSENLETAPPSAELGEQLAEADLITVTGGIGYITERTFDHIFESIGDAAKPWVASLCLRTVPYAPVADCLARHGLVTERLPDVTFAQRRFADDAEREFALGELAARGVDPSGKEAEGWYHVDVFLSRPKDDADVAITDLLAEAMV